MENIPKLNMPDYLTAPEEGKNFLEMMWFKPTEKDRQEAKDIFERQGFIKTNIPGEYIDPKTGNGIHDLVNRPIKGEENNEK